MPEYIQLNRKFSLFTSNNDDPETNWDYFNNGLNTGNTIGWNELLNNQKVIILAEAGAGKTDELKAVAAELHKKGKASFFSRIEMLLEQDFELLFDIGTEEEFTLWKESKEPENIGYFFLDSVDEAKLKSNKAFEIALKRFVSTIGANNLTRTKVFITSRATEWRAKTDLHLFCNIFNLPTPKAHENEIIYKLESLNDKQILTFATAKGITSPQAFLDDIKRADAEIFATRPQDLLDLIAYWQENGKLGRHIEVVEFSISRKLRESNLDRGIHDPLSIDSAILGAEILAATATLTRKNKILLPEGHIDTDLSTLIDPEKALPVWKNGYILALLTRPIFDEEIYGSVRFHHRSVREFLTAKWLYRLLSQEGSRRGVESLLFAEVYGREVATPSMQPITAWLACWDDKIRNKLEQVAPEVLIENGDPSEFSLEYRIHLLDSVISQYQGHQRTDLQIDPLMMKRLASPDIAEAINIRLKDNREHHDLCRLFLHMIWYGRVSGSIEQAQEIALSEELGERIQGTAFHAVLAAGTEYQKRLLIKQLLEQGQASKKIVGGKCDELFPDYLSVGDLLLIMQASPQTDRYSNPSLHYYLSTLSSNNPSLHETTLLELLSGMRELIHQQPFTTHGFRCIVSKQYKWLIANAIEFANQLLQQKSKLSFHPTVLDLYQLCFICKDSGYHFSLDENKKLLDIAKDWNEFSYELFWYMAHYQQNGEHLSTTWQSVQYATDTFWTPKLEDWDILSSELTTRKNRNEKEIALSALYYIYKEFDQTSDRLFQLKQLASLNSTTQGQLEKLLNPPPLTKEQLKYINKKAEREKKSKKQKLIKQNRRKKFVASLRNDVKKVANIGNPKKGTAWKRSIHLHSALRERYDNNISTKSMRQWSLLIDEFGREVAENFRDGCIDYWRKYRPISVTNRSSWGETFGLMGLAMEADLNPNWFASLSSSEAILAAQYALLAWDGFPEWFSDLRTHFSNEVDAVLIDEIRYELSPSFTGDYSKILQRIFYSQEVMGCTFRESILDILEANKKSHKDCVKYALAIILSSSIQEITKKRLSVLACRRFLHTHDLSSSIMWLHTLLIVNAKLGLKILKAWLTQLPNDSSRQDVANQIIAELGDDRNSDIRAIDPEYEELKTIESLIPLVYQYIRFENDIHRSGSGIYSPGARDNAQRARQNILEIVANTKSQKAYSLMQLWAEESCHQWHKDWLLRLAKNRAELDSEFISWIEGDISEFAHSYQKLPKNEGELYQIAIDRIVDLKDDLEKGDDSIAKTVRRIDQETELRRWLAREFRKVSNNKYEISQEEEMADDTRRDIRFRMASITPIPVELKIADNWSFNNFFERLKNQLIKQYMLKSQYGIFLLVFRDEKSYWQDDYKREYSFSELKEESEAYAAKLVTQYENITGLRVIGIDLTRRNSKELPKKA